MSEPTTRLNAALQGRYAIERQLGEGGMATVYLADDLKHERKVALKVLKPELAVVVGAERFLAEIKTTAKLQHPHILPLFDSGEVDGFLFYVMPYVEGESLRERIDRERQLGVDDSLAITQKVASALEYAHGNGVIHRDIKPANILLQDGEPLVADFGIALAVAQVGGGRITETGVQLGTPHYMSPEQATGDRDVDARWDVYALGCVLYEMLAGRPPFAASTPQAVLIKILTTDAPSITSERRTVPPHVGHALAKALEKLPADRFRSAAEFASALRDRSFTFEARRQISVGATPESPAAQVPATRLRRWNRMTVAFATTSALLAALAVRGWLGPVPQLPVTRSSIEVGDLSLRALGEIMVSPDGSRFALAGLSQPSPLYWRNADEEEFRPIPGTEGANWASFSPDGESLVFGTSGGGLLQRVALSGGAPQFVATLPTASAGGVHWGDDGNVVFSLSGGFGLYRVPASGGEPEVLLDPSTPVRNARLLPGGRAVIFTQPRVLSTYLLDLDADSVRVLQEGAIDAVYVETGHLLYADAAGTLWAVAFDAGAGEVVGEPATLFDGLTKPQLAYARFSVSNTGTLVYGAGPGDGAGEVHRLLLVDLEGNEERLALSPRNIGEVEWSPNGRSIVYESVAQGDLEPNVFTYDVQLGTTPRQLTFEGNNRRPVFSPDGTRVAMSSRREGTDGFDLFVKTLDDDAPAGSIITLPGDEFVTQWPSDTLIMFEQGPNPSELWTLNLSDPDSPVAEVYLPLEADLDDIVVSTDGALAAYGSDETGTDEVYIRGFPEPGEPIRVSQGGGQYPSWSPDGNTVYYWTQEGDAGVTFMAARIRRDPTLVVVARDALFTGNYIPGNSALHPDGNRVLVPQSVAVATGPEGRAADTERFIVVTNWFEELRRRMGN